MTRIELPGEKSVQHLTLLRQSRVISPKEFNALSADERLAMIRNADNHQRYRLLIEAADGRDLLQRLPEEEVYLLLKELDSEAREELMPLLGGGQFTACIDLDSWNGDSFNADSALDWLEGLLIADDEESILDTVRLMNFELLLLLVRRHVTIIHGPEAIDDEDERNAALLRDGGYELDWRSERAAKSFGYLFGILFSLDPGFYAYLMEAARAETDALIEESVYQQRGDRMLDMGFPLPDEARAIYAWIDPEAFHVDGSKLPIAGTAPEMAAPTFMLEASTPAGLLAEALQGGLSEAASWELAFLANKVLLADQVEFGHHETRRQALERLYAIFNLGLEYRCDTTAAVAGDVLEQTYFEHLFQLGYSLTLRLQRHAIKIAASTIGPWLEKEDRALLVALQRKPHPLYPNVDGERSFGSLNDYRLATTQLERLDLLAQLFEQHLPFTPPTPDDVDLAGCTPVSRDDITLSTLLLTALANRLLGRDFTPAPIPGDELPGLHGRISRGGKIDPQLRNETVSQLDGLLTGSGAFVNESLDLLEREFCAIDPAHIDPRFVGGLIVRRK